MNPLPLRSETRCTEAADPDKRLRWSIGLFAMIGVLAAGCGVDIDIDTLDGDVRVETSTFDGIDATVIDVRTVSGRIDIDVNDSSAETNKITVRAEIKERNTTGTVVATELDGRLELRGTCANSGRCSIDYDITIPHDLDVVVQTENGRVQVDGLSGALEVKTANGRIDAAGLSSTSVDAASKNGRIELQFARPPTDVRADAANGKIDITLPDTPTEYALDVASGNGSIDTDVRADETSERRIVAKTRNGAIDIRTDND